MCGEKVCIYCREDSSNATSKEHVIPESLGCKETLPRGYICNSCNNYFSDMDKIVLYNRYIGMRVGTEEIPGKNGKIRKHIGERLRFSKKGALEIILGPATIPAGTHHGMKLDFRLEQSKEFDELLFARGIHKIAFNCYAYRFGHRSALHSRFNNLRRYIRYANKGELWIYAVKESYNFENECIAIVHETRWGEAVDLRLLSLDFLISLTGWRSEIESKITANDTNIIHRKGQWKASTLLGLQK
jgi:hypothetical protein